MSCGTHITFTESGNELSERGAAQRIDSRRARPRATSCNFLRFSTMMLLKKGCAPGSYRTAKPGKSGSTSVTSGMFSPLTKGSVTGCLAGTWHGDCHRGMGKIVPGHQLVSRDVLRQRASRPDGCLPRRGTLPSPVRPQQVCGCPRDLSTWYYGSGSPDLAPRGRISPQAPAKGVRLPGGGRPRNEGQFLALDPGRWGSNTPGGSAA